MLDAFFLRVPRPDQVLEVERAFVLKLTHPVTGEIAPVPLIGAMDAFVVDEGKTEVWELKTGKKKWSADQLEYDLQPTAYVMRWLRGRVADAGTRLFSPAHSAPKRRHRRRPDAGRSQIDV